MNELERKAMTLRRKVLEMSVETGDAHIGGSFSEIEILIALYNGVIKSEDKFILSKGHCSYPLYILLKDNGYNPKINTHPNIEVNQGISCTTGSLGHGMPIGVGMAMAKKRLNLKGNIYVLLGDGECEEGTTWESSLIASKYKLDNLTVIVDNNGLQALDKLVLPLDNLAEKFRAFGFNATEIDGHNFNELITTFNQRSYLPKVIIAKTIKGKGISYMENDAKWHTRMPNKEELKRAYEELKDTEYETLKTIFETDSRWI